MASLSVIHSLFNSNTYDVQQVWGHPRLSTWIFITAAWLGWRYWAFTVKPLINPRCPRPLPYLIPFLGHAISFLKNPEGLLSYGREYFGNTRQPFAITIAGEIFYVLTSADDVTKMYKNSSTLSFDGLLFDMIKQFGSSHEMVEKLFEDRPSNPPMKSVVHLGHDWQVQQTRGKGLNYLDAQIRNFFENSFTFCKVKSEHSFVLEATEKDLVVSLKGWTGDVIASAIQNAYFGGRLFDINPGLVNTLMKFDMLAWQVFYRYPPFLSRHMNCEREIIIQTLENYFQLPPEERPGEAWFIRTLEAEYRSIGFSDREIATVMMFTYWGINTNVSKTCFWALAYVVHDPELLIKVRNEISPAFTNGVLNVHYISEACPLLNSIWLETLRLAAVSSSVRYINEDTTIGGLLLQRGNKIMVSARQLHFDKAAFGRDGFKFEPQRFYKDPGLQRSPSFRPFGGGVTLCPGRHLAKHTVLTFISLALHRFDITLASPQPFPQFEERKPIVGIMMGDDDLLLRLQVRSVKLNQG